MFNRLHIYSVHRKPGSALPEEVKFVKEGFSFPAFFLMLVWLLYQRLWLVAGGVFAVQLALYALKVQHMLHPVSVAAAQLGVQVMVGFMANDWLRSRLKRQGYITADIVTGDSKLRAEQRYFERLLAPQAALG